MSALDPITPRSAGSGLGFVQHPQLRAKIERARILILLDHPFIAAAVMGIPVIELPPPCAPNDGEMSDSALPLARCRLPNGFGTNGRAILVDVGALRLSDHLAQEHYLHNLMHCLFEHVSRRGTRRQDIWNAAIDVAATALMRSFLPRHDDIWIDHGDTGFTANDAIHDIETTGTEDRLLDPRDSYLQHAASCWAQASCEQIYDSFLAIVKNRPEQDGEDCRLARLLINRARNSGHMEHLGGFIPPSALPSPDELEEIRHHVYESAKVHGRTVGTEPGGMRERASVQPSQTVDWRRVFAERLQSLVPSDYRSYPFSKRHLWRGVLLPSLGGRTVGRILFAIDTSGSMDIKILGEIVDQLDQLRQLTGCSITLVHFDSALQKEIDLEEDGLSGGLTAEADVLDMCGRGGTDIRVPFQVLERRMRASDNFVGIVVATDGFGPLPTLEPAIPTVWLVPQMYATRFTAPFGTVIACTPSAANSR